jgi:hypothetical protein
MKLRGDSEVLSLTAEVERDEIVRGANVDLPQRKVGKTPTQKEIATRIIAHMSMHDELFGASHLGTRLSALKSACQGSRC